MSEFSSLYIKTRVVTLRVKEVVTFCVEKLLHFALVVTLCGETPHIYKICYFIGTGEEPERKGENLIKTSLVSSTLRTVVV